MSFDKSIADLIAAVTANTEAINALREGGSVSTSTEKPADAKADTKVDAKAETKPRGRRASAPKDDAYTPKYSQSEMQAAVNEVKNELGTAEAKQLIKDAGHDRLADVTDPKKIDELYEAARAKIEGGSGDGDDDEGL